MKKSLYDILNIKKGATKKEIKDAFREKAKQNHPDKGGDENKMKEIVKAYTVLNDDNKRKRYDDTGQEDAEQDFESRFFATVNQIFMQIVDNKDVDTTDLIGEFKKVLKQTEKNLHDHKKQQKERITKLEKVKKRLKTKGNSVILTVVEGHISTCQQSLADIDNEIDYCTKVMAVCDEYGYDFDKVQKYEFHVNYGTGEQAITIEEAEKLFENWHIDVNKKGK